MRVIFADESGTTGPGCYGIGALSVEESALPEFNRYFQERVARHRVIGEAKWQKVSKSASLINLTLELTFAILRSEHAHFSCIVVDKGLYRNWRSGQEESAFYKTYSQNIRHITSELGGDVQVYMDEKSDSYPKHDEVLQIVTNHMLRRVASGARISSVKMEQSRLSPGIQAVDLLTGPIVAAHNLKVSTRASVNPGKALLIKRMAEVLGWDDLCYDTMPHSLREKHFNIWQFPIETRASRGTKAISVVRPRTVTVEDVQNLSRGDSVA